VWTIGFCTHLMADSVDKRAWCYVRQCYTSKRLSLTPRYTVHCNCDWSDNMRRNLQNVIYALLHVIACIQQLPVSGPLKMSLVFEALISTFYASALCNGSIVFALSDAVSVCPVFRPVPNIIFLSLCNNTAQISMKFAGVNRYQEQIK